ncbi:uncharacterized protein LOC128259734 [Drosophila gunungcola]|uniref:Uncharacterized protein n=1 Tax=Drosophila gunungcola TaxID=103775 RepID=A0A9P9YIR2_9MUSC|nr:uncharacterized protein LOC128259734 [Drosophila gunungcola]KAI8037750.1 hypothetical protein M5D96_009250 [Drosophila gunungcola]
MHQHLTFVGIILLGPLVRTRALHSSGNCTFANNELLKFVCKSTVTTDMYSLFHDNRAPPDTTFSVWEGEEKEDGDAILLISFYTTQLTNYDSISLQGSVGGWDKHFFLVNYGNLSNVPLFIIPSTIHCFSFSLRYPKELKRHCLGYGIATDGGDVAKKPILHYGSLSFKKPVVTAGGASASGPVGALLFVVFAVIIH